MINISISKLRKRCI